jgi:hypothetical protein
VNRPLELRCPPRFEHETARGHAAAVDVDFNDAVERPEVAKPQAIHLSGAREYVTRLALLHATAPVRDDIDRKITDTHRPLLEATFRTLRRLRSIAAGSTPRWSLQMVPQWCQ